MTEVWTPHELADFDKIDQTTLECGRDLHADHPGFHDATYRERRAIIVQNAQQYRFTDPAIPHVEYSAEEQATWKTVFRTLSTLYPTMACSAFNSALAKLGYSPDRVPQLDDVSRTIHEVSGWQLRPVGGLLLPRQFLNALAFRCFHCTQYMRHPSQPFYTAEPDVIHDLVGHVPMLLDKDFAEFSRMIGQASIGASEEFIGKLTTLYWFTVEFGLCREGDGSLRAFGAGLLSSYGELQYSLGVSVDGAEGGTPVYHPFDIPRIVDTPYPITSYQPAYFVADSMAQVQRVILEWLSIMQR